MKKNQIHVNLGRALHGGASLKTEIMNRRIQRPFEIISLRIQVVGAQMKRQRTFFFFFDLMMIGKQKIEAVLERSRLPTRASPMLRSHLSDPGGGHGKKLSAT